MLDNDIVSQECMWDCEKMGHDFYDCYEFCKKHKEFDEVKFRNGE